MTTPLFFSMRAHRAQYSRKMGDFREMSPLSTRDLPSTLPGYGPCLWLVGLNFNPTNQPRLRIRFIRIQTQWRCLPQTPFFSISSSNYSTRLSPYFVFVFFSYTVTEKIVNRFGFFHNLTFTVLQNHLLVSYFVQFGA